MEIRLNVETVFFSVVFSIIYKFRSRLSLCVRVLFFTLKNQLAAGLYWFHNDFAARIFEHFFFVSRLYKKRKKLYTALL